MKTSEMLRTFILLVIMKSKISVVFRLKNVAACQYYYALWIIDIQIFN